MPLREIELLKIDMLQNGVKVTDEARRAIEGDSHRPMTLAEYASTSGLALKLDKDVWINAPIHDYNPNFVGEHPPHELDYRDGFFVRSAGAKSLGLSSMEVEATFIPVAAYHDKRTPRGERYSGLAVTHTDRVRISPIEGCAFVCDFCNIPFEFKYRRKEPDELVEAVRLALTDEINPAKHVLISGGTPGPKHYEWLNGVWERIASEFPEVDVDVMMVPTKHPQRGHLMDPERLNRIGIAAVYVNMELWNKDAARRIMGNKEKVSRAEYLNFVEKATDVLGRGNGRVRSLLLVGIESQKDTLQGVRELARRGCDPILSPFRPDPHTPMKDWKPPSAEYLVDTYVKARDIIGEEGKTTGVVLGPRCIPCHHNTLTFPDGSGRYYYS